MDQRVDGGWFARLEVQKPGFSPLVIRPCTDLQTGRRGCVLWVCRHEARLRAEVAQRIADRPSNRWAARST